MERNFSAVMSELRHARGLSQRKVAADLKISQALLSHYENGAREPGLAFVCRACVKNRIEVVCMDIHNAVWHIEQRYYIDNTIKMSVNQI